MPTSEKPVTIDPRRYIIASGRPDTSSLDAYRREKADEAIAYIEDRLKRGLSLPRLS